MWIAKTIDQCRARRRELTGPVGFVPTMGALHAGHLSLIHTARQHADHVLVSIFVNPTQFAPHEDLDRYPRDLDADLKQCEAAGVDGVFCPSVDQMYPPDQVDCQINVPALAEPLEGEFRPTFLPGVCRVVTKLLNIMQPDVACWGRKDYQQYLVVNAMTHDMAMPVQNVLCPTVRDDDGLALSSRNRYLTDEQRRHGLGLYKALCQARDLVEQQGETDPHAVEAAMDQILTAHHLAVDYATVRHPHTLGPLDCLEPALTGGLVGLIAARVDNVRLIDNMPIGAA